MAKFTRNFLGGRMNKVVDQRLLPEGEYVDAMNVRMGSTENSEIGVIENTKGNVPITSLAYIDGTPLSNSAKCIGAIEDSANETLYWFVHDPDFSIGDTGKLDLIVSFNVYTNILTYIVISINDSSNLNTTLNFNPSYLITGVNIIDNLLFFTDNYNPPRFINVTTQNYPNPIANIDAITAESLLVIKKPPIESPTVIPIFIGGQENYLETRFISFAYRYKYANSEYSATSQWSEPSFVPNPFNFSFNSFLNEGMTNYCNSAIIEYNTGGPLVVGIDLLFKRSDGNVIKVIEKLNKLELGLTNDTIYQYNFTNSKIFTILSESELLRLYDNVPRLAKSQTIMGNRLMYGNYVEGYDLLDIYGNPIKFEYTTLLLNEEIGISDINTGSSGATYSIDESVNEISIANATLTIDLVGLNLVNGASISVDVSIGHSQFSGTQPPPEEKTESVSLEFVFFLTKTYTSVYQLATSEEFQNLIGTSSNIKSVPDACVEGLTFTDSFNCLIPQNLDQFDKTASGIVPINSLVNQPIQIITQPSNTYIGFQFPAMEYVDSSLAGRTIYEYYEVQSATASFQEIANPKSLHSNRDYEIGIVYMDEYNRSSTVLVSTNNTTHIPCAYSSYKNSIQVTIPPTQLPPFWAKRYKFVIKPSEENYETIYTNIIFEDPNSNFAYLLLEGENARKVEVGDDLVVKSDSNGVVSNCVKVTILEKSSKSSGFLEIPSNSDSTVFVNVPEGVYAKINPNNISFVQDELAVIAPGKIEETTGYYTYPIVVYPMNTYNLSTELYEDYTVPIGSRIVLSIKQWRDGKSAKCEERTNTLEKSLISNNTYDNMYKWWVGDNISSILNSGIRYAGEGEDVPNNEFIPTILMSPPDDYRNIPKDLLTNYYQFIRDIASNALSLVVTGTVSCGVTKKGSSQTSVEITVFRSDNTLIFETEPSDALPDVFFENEMSFPIENGNHIGNVQNQNIILGTPAIIDTKFFNCFAFGNGVESYKIRDSIVGNSFGFGNRVTSVSAQEYKESKRFADITYSGIYNAESNINKLNEFNLGLLNYKNLEASFGEIYVMDGRQTDILVLQEDKISYVLTGKNLLSDSTGGGAIASVPEVLGTQIARSEKYGISFNPESYVQWGYDRYFTDVKRGVVLQLKGDSYSQDQLKVVSEMNMRTWFRDTFNESFNTQKLGGFDPYMNEYVLSSNTIQIPSNPQCLECGISQTFTLTTIASEIKTTTFCVDLGPTIGIANTSYNVSSISGDGEFEISLLYNGITTSTGWITSSGVLPLDKNKISEETVTVTISYKGDLVLDVLSDCCNADQLTIIQVVFTNDYDSAKTIATQYRYVDGDFVSPLQSNTVIFSSGTNTPIVSRYNLTTDKVGSGAFPPSGSTLKLISNQSSSDTFVFNPATDEFKYLVSGTLYSNNSAEMNTLLGLATTITPNQGGGTNNYAEFTVPTLNTYLYLIWDFRSSSPVDLCYSNIDVSDVCCNC